MSDVMVVSKRFYLHHMLKISEIKKVCPLQINCKFKIFDRGSSISFNKQNYKGGGGASKSFFNWVIPSNSKFYVFQWRGVNGENILACSYEHLSSPSHHSESSKGSG